MTANRASTGSPETIPLLLQEKLYKATTTRTSSTSQTILLKPRTEAMIGCHA
jgi:hypothetical protein